MKKLLPLSVLLLLTVKLFAQAHLKDVQTTSIWAPANVKIDGNIGEWEDSFQAYNKTTKLFYTISNNDKYLYLAVTCTDAPNNTKIAAGGITFTINTAGKKKDKDAYTITFPVVTRGRGRGGQRGPGGRGGGRPQTDAVDTAAVKLARKQFIESSKEIKVLGFKDVEDTVISIYNEYGFKSAIGYDDLGNYSYELAVPLKMLNIASGDTKDIAYNLKVNGLQVNVPNRTLNITTGGDATVSTDGGGGPPGGGGGGGRGGRGGGARTARLGGPGGGNIDYADLTSPTDFWGKYTLAKQ